MNKNENLQPSKELIIKKLEAVSLPAINLCEDPDKFALYQRFQEIYSGHPYNPAELPPIKRTIADSKDVDYNFALMSALTESGSHMIHVRQANGGHELESKQRYFVVTADFGTMDITEWDIENADYNPGDAFNGAQLSLYLSKNPGPDKNLEYQAHPDDDAMTMVKVSRIIENIRKCRQADKILLQMSNGPAKLWWGNFREPETFVSMQQIEADLRTIHQAQELGLIRARNIKQRLDMHGLIFLE